MSSSAYAATIKKGGILDDSVEKNPEFNGANKVRSAHGLQRKEQQQLLAPRGGSTVAQVWTKFGRKCSGCCLRRDRALSCLRGEDDMTIWGCEVASAASVEGATPGAGPYRGLFSEATFG